jgi:hypothetical protein
VTRVAKILIIANETVGGRRLVEAVRERAKDDDAEFILVVPQNRPRHGGIIYDEAVRDSAQVRVDLAQQFLRHEGVALSGEIGDEDPFQAAMDAIDEHRPDEVIVSTLPMSASGWLRKDLVQRIADSSGLPVEHVVVDLDNEGLPYTLTLVVANQTVEGAELLDTLKAKAADDEHLFLVVVPQDGGQGHHVGEARTRLRGVLEHMRGDGLLCAGMIGDPDPYAAAMNSLAAFHANEVVISTLPEEKSGWLRAKLPERIQETSGVPVEHVVVSLEDLAKAQA